MFDELKNVTCKIFRRTSNDEKTQKGLKNLELKYLELVAGKPNWSIYALNAFSHSP